MENKKEMKLLEDRLETILKDFIEDFRTKKDLPFVVKNSIPIVWFGNIDKYFKSTLKVVTVGLNPSEQEFMYKDANDNMIELPNREKRFDIVNFESGTDTEQITKLKETLNNYFNKNPYKWFNKYEKILNVFGCSYKSSLFGNTGIHIDIYSAIATSPTIGKLNEKEKSILKNFNLFKHLLSLLNPDIILISTNKKVFIEQFPNAQIIAEHNFPGNNYINAYKHEEALIFHGTNMQGIPFGGIKEYLIQNILFNTFRSSFIMEKKVKETSSIQNICPKFKQGISLGFLVDAGVVIKKPCDACSHTHFCHFES